MDQNKEAVQNWVIKAFQVGGYNLPEHLITHYVQQLINGSLSFQQVQEEVLMFARPHSQDTSIPHVPNQTPTKPTTQQPITTVQTPPKPTTTAHINPKDEIQQSADQLLRDEEKLKIQQQIGFSKPVETEVNKLKEYIDQLYITFTGKKGDPASTNYLINSIADKSYSLTQAEFFVKFSKEAKAYAKVVEKNKEQKKIQQIQEYVKELFRVYLKKINPTTDEVSDYAASILDGSRTLQDVEDEIKLLSLNPPSK